MTKLLWIPLLKRLMLSILLVGIFERRLKMAAIKGMLHSVLQHTSLRKYSFI